MRYGYSLFMPVFTFILIHVTAISFAQQDIPTINAIPLPVGSGARALGQGGAFIAVADDATAASWNPGGLTQLERPEFSLVGSFLFLQQDFDHDNDSLLSLDKEEAHRGELNYMSVAYPFEVFGKNLVAALNYQQKYDFLADLNLDEVDPVLNLEGNIDFESHGGVGALTPAISMQVIPRLSIGVAVNFYTDEYFKDFAWKEKTRGTEKGTTFLGSPFEFRFDKEQTFKNFQAVNATIGLLWDVWEREGRRFTVGAVYHSPYTADVDRITNSKSVLNGDKEPDDYRREHFRIEYPQSIGAGLGFRYSDALSLSLDVTWTEWSKFMQKDERGNETRPLGGASENRDMNDLFAVRLGTEYLIFKQKVIIPVRCGLFYDPRPSLNSSTDVYGFSVGSGITFKRLSFDGAYQFRWSTNADGEDLSPDLKDIPFNFYEHLFLASVIVYF